MFFDDVKRKKVKGLGSTVKTASRPNFLPFELMSDVELVNLPTYSYFIYDTEAYTNYWLAAFKHVDSGKVVFFEKSPDSEIDCGKFRWFMHNFTTIGFNSRNYDNTIVAFAIAGFSTNYLKAMSDELIKFGKRSYDLLKENGLKPLEINYIDLIEVCPLSASLKSYAARVHCRLIQDLPINPDKILTQDEANAIKEYCINDLDNTLLLFNELSEQIKLRMQMSFEYNTDLRSKSDAQIAEAVIMSEIKKLRGFKPKKPEIDGSISIQYKAPNYLQFKTPLLQNTLSVITNSYFCTDSFGSPVLPFDIENLDLRIGNSKYTLGIGGLHSTEKCSANISDEFHIIKDIDVESFYPRIILNLGLYPKHLSTAFLTVYDAITQRRIEAKRAKNNVVADSLKITINGSFGKFGSQYSNLYSPDLMLAVTLTGQLSLLLLIERIELEGIRVISANTDGIVIKCPRNREIDLNNIIKQWEADTNFKTEETLYAAIYSRDVNNYIAIKTDGKCKLKGAYSNPWNDPKTAIFRFHKNPECTISIEAVEKYLVNKTPLLETIMNCKDIRKFVAVRNVKGGAEKDGVYLGKVVRWYYAHNTLGTIQYVTNGNKVPKTDGAKPIMEFTSQFPNDIDHKRYEQISIEILEDIGYYQSLKLC